ncbi:hypothetical protein MCUN1_000141 [Malassezia cuniculi]|uniref:Non-structural maintenance of chromosomes element 4 n=1 Tax=Malassezia cuniculi TaxID=948313 RepID=A0AAF0J4L7_9BASI|nr:hypothetical protein MCUN1_000141 [Malassezia cuniculi]
MDDASSQQFEYEPHPNVEEQRELRKEYRALLASAQNTQRHLPESTIQDLGDLVQLGDDLYTKVKAPTEGLLDARFLLKMSDMGAEMTRNMRLDANAFDIDELLQRVVQYMGDGEPTTWDWDRLGMLAAQNSHRAPTCDFLLGPLQVQPKQRKQSRRTLLDSGAQQQAPQQLGERDIVQTENETSRIVLDIARRLDDAGGDTGVNLFRFALNPESFGNTVENLFYLSFLIRDGKAAIFYDDNNEPLVMSSEEPTEQDRSEGLTRRQIVFELDEDTWRGLLSTYHITEPMIPTRAQEPTAAPPGGWYT